MSARMVRIKKEMRALFGPWCAVVIAGALPVIMPHSYTAVGVMPAGLAESLSFLSFFFGVPLLATLSLGDEFRYGTLSLWLAQPSSRLQLWGEKMSVMCPAALSAALVSGVVMFSFTWPHTRLAYKIAAAAYVIVTMASATLWTLTTKSTLGSLALDAGILFLGALFSRGVEAPFRSSPLLDGSPAGTITVILAFGICFAALTLWLGARKLARFQATGGSSGEDLLMAGPSVMPEVLAGWFRSRPSGASLNLIRKEFRLLRPLWLTELLVLLYVAFLATFRLLPAPSKWELRTGLEWALLGPLLSVCVAMAGLAGILSLGEERSSGTQAWQMTLPVSARRQWLIKLVVAMFSGLACAVVFPVLAMIAGGAVFGSPLMYVNAHSLPDVLIMFGVLTFACFWCACAANGTVRAAISVVPVTAAIPFASFAGLWLGEELAQFTGTLKDFMVSSLRLSPLALTTISDFARSTALWLFIPAMLLGLIQSYRLFRTEPDDSVLRMLRSILPLAAVTMLWSFSASAGFLYSRWEPFAETRQALDQFHPATAKLELTGEDLARSSSFTALTRRWLRGARIAVAPAHSHLPGYLATIHLASGLECRLRVTHHGGTAASCGN